MRHLSTGCRTLGRSTWRWKIRGSHSRRRDVHGLWSAKWPMLSTPTLWRLPYFPTSTKKLLYPSPTPIFDSTRTTTLRIPRSRIWLIGTILRTSSFWIIWCWVMRSWSPYSIFWRKIHTHGFPILSRLWRTIGKRSLKICCRLKKDSNCLI